MNATENRGEVKTAETLWRGLTEQFGERRFCRLCGREISEHRCATHDFVPKIHIDEEMTDERALKEIDYYLCINRNELYLKRVTRPDRALLDKDYAVYERLSGEPLWLQKALITSGRLRDFLELAREGEEHEGRKKRIGELSGIPSLCSSSDAARTDSGSEGIGGIVTEIGDSTDSIWRNSYSR